ncbi:MAG: hypothetical protein ACXVIS_08455 [Halobacteriota archaeon]
MITEWGAFSLASDKASLVNAASITADAGWAYIKGLLHPLPSFSFVRPWHNSSNYARGAYQVVGRPYLD